MNILDDDEEEIARGIRRRLDRVEAARVRRPQGERFVSSASGTAGLRLRVSGQNVTLAFAAVVVIILAALVFRPLVRSQTSPGAESSLHETGRVDLPGPVYDLAVDPSQSAFWFAFMSAGSEDDLYRFDIVSQHMSHWPLPPTDHNGFLERVAVAPDGGVWVTEEYSVVRFDPSTSKMATHTFAEADPDATATALEPTDPSPGTWPAAIAFDSAGDALVSRHNVTTLIRFDDDLNIVGRIKLPEGMAGPGDLVDVGGLIYAAPYGGSGDTLTFSESGAANGSVAAGTIRFAIEGGQVLSIGGGGLMSIGETAHTSRLLPAEGSPADRIAPSANGVAVYLDGPGIIEVVALDGTKLASITLPDVPLVVGNPKGVPQTVYSRAEVGAMASDAKGSVWYVDVSARALVHLER